MVLLVVQREHVVPLEDDLLRLPVEVGALGLVRGRRRLVQQRVQRGVGDPRVVREVAAGGGDGAVRVVEDPQHVGADLRVRRGDGLVLVGAEGRVPAGQVEGRQHDVEADRLGVGLDLLEQRLLGGDRLVGAHGEPHGEPLAVPRPVAVVVARRPPGLVQQGVRAADPDPGIETLFAGTATRSSSPLSSVEPTAYGDADLFGTDVDAANTLLDEAGWTERDADGYRTKDGERLTLRFPVSTNQSVAAEQSLFEQIQANTKAVGFEVVITPLDLSGWYTALGANEYEIVSAPYTKVGPDVLRILYHSSGIVPAPSGYFANHAQVSDPALDAALDSAAATTDQAERAELYAQAQQTVLDGFFILPLYDQQNHFLTRGVDGVRTLHTVGTPTFLDTRLAS